jgi:superfamily I DNA/RNA helicase
MRVSDNQRIILGPPGCVDKDTEYLSPTGWKKISEYTGGMVCQYNPETHTTSWVEPEEYVVAPCEEMFKIQTKYGLDQMLSFGHRVLWYSTSHGSVTGPFTSPALELYTESRRIKYPVMNIPTTVPPPGGCGIPLSDEQLRIMVAVIADGSFVDSRTKCCVRIKKERKKTRLRELLAEAAIQYTESDLPCERGTGFVRFYFVPPLRTKVFDRYWWDCSLAQLRVIAEELVHWDGSVRKSTSVQFFTSVKDSADFAQYAYLSLNKTARLRTTVRKDGSTEYDVYVSEKKLSGIFGGTVDADNFKIVPTEDGKMYCFNVPSSYLLLRRNGRVFVTGNTGKTTVVLSEIERLMAEGVAPDKIAFVSFTKKAVTEAVDRASDKFGLTKRDFPLWRTIHSLAFNGLGVSKKDMVGREHYKEFGQHSGYRFTGTWDESEGVPVGDEKGDTLLFLDNLARITQRTLKEIWEENYTVCEWDELERFQDGYQDFKSASMLMDFTDLLYAYTEMCDPSTAEYVFVDEGQDLSAAQWMVLKHAFGNVLQTTIAGDDDQSIYKWSGADVNAFLALEGTKTVLTKSYRLPRSVHQMATTMVSKIETRFDKQFTARDSEGEVGFFNSLYDVDVNSDERTLFLVRNTFLSTRVSERLHELGIPYMHKGYSSVKAPHVKAIHAIEKLRNQKSIMGSEAKAMYDAMRVGYYLERGKKSTIIALGDNEEVDFQKLNQEHGLKDLAPWYTALDGIPQQAIDYYRSVLSNGYKLTATPNCSISTIHAAKGGEAEHVVVLSDMAYRSFQEYEKEPDNERRVAYVGVTRAKEKLSVIQPQGRLFFDYYQEGN